jgi:hypothetical protein
MRRVTMTRAGRLRNRCLVPGKARRFVFFHKASRSHVGLIQRRIWWVAGSFSWELKRPAVEAKNCNVSKEIVSSILNVYTFVIILKAF